VARTAAIALGCISTALCILTVVAFSRARKLKRELTEARRDVARLAGRADSLATSLAGVEGELHKLRLAHVDATPKNRGAARAEEQDRRGEQAILRLPERADLETLTKSIRVLAEGFGAGPVGAAAGGEARRERLPPEAEKRIAGSLDGMANGVELWREYRQGKMADREFDRRRHKLRDSARGDIGFFFGILWRERLKGATKERREGKAGAGEVF
jgi:hypothetical protein